MTAIEAGLVVALRPGTQVEVLTRYDRRWTRGFEIASVVHDRFVLRRHSDGALLPTSFAAHELRPRR